jgi:hypothetical protein
MIQCHPLLPTATASRRLAAPLAMPRGGGGCHFSDESDDLFSPPLKGKT